MVRLSKRVSACGCYRNSKLFTQPTCYFFFFKHAIVSVSIMLQKLTYSENQLAYLFKYRGTDNPHFIVDVAVAVVVSLY